MHFLTGQVLEVEIHFEVGFVVYPGGRVHLFYSSQLALESSFGGHEGLVFFAVVEAVVHEGDGVVGLKNKGHFQ